MRYYFVELLACPVCKHFPLELYPIEVEDRPLDEDTLLRVKCKEYCAYLRRPANEVSLETCRECSRKYIKTGVLICPSCGRWYPILDGIPRLLDDKYRRRIDDLRFLKQYYKRVPAPIRTRMRVPDPNSLLEERPA